MKSIALSILAALALSGAGCSSEGPAERAGKDIDEAVDDLGEEIGEAADEVEEETEEARRKAREALD
jgi:hypothetical protein